MSFPCSPMLFLSLVFTLYITATQASIFVTNPLHATVCHGGQPCEVQWVDDGQAPVLSEIGACNIALYTGKQQVLQQIATVDVSSSASVTFTPNPEAGPDSSSYYIGFTALNTTVNGTAYVAFSASFTLDDMQGSSSSTLSGASSVLPLSSSTQSTTKTITIGTLSTSSAPGPSQTATMTSPTSPTAASTKPTSSGFVTSSIPNSVTPSASSAAISTSPPSSSINPSTLSSSILSPNSISPLPASSNTTASSTLPSASPLSNSANKQTVSSAYGFISWLFSTWLMYYLFF